MDRDNEALRRRIAEQAAASGQSQESSDDDDTYAVREGVTRAIDPDEIELRGGRAVAEDDDTARLQADIAGFDPERELAKPPDLPESVDVTNVAPDGTTVPDGTSQLTGAMGETIGGDSGRDSVISGLGGLSVDGLDRGLDYDPLTPGNQDEESRPGGRETTGDPSVDRAIQSHDGSQFGMDVEFGPVTVIRPDPVVVQGEEMEFPLTPRVQGEEMEFPLSPPGGGGPPGASKMENPDADSGDSVTNLGRVTVMQGSQVQPSNNPDDPATGAGSTDNWIPPADLETMPTQDGETADTTLTSAATLGSSPLTNPTDPVLGDDGIIHGVTYDGSGGSGGGDTPESMTARSGGDASAVGGYAAATSSETNVNNVSVGTATGQVIGSAAPALGVESAMADPAAAMADPAAAMGGSVIGSSTPEDFPPPPDPPPADDPDDGPPEGGGDEG